MTSKEVDKIPPYRVQVPNNHDKWRNRWIQARAQNQKNLDARAAAALTPQDYEPVPEPDYMTSLVRVAATLGVLHIANVNFLDASSEAEELEANFYSHFEELDASTLLDDPGENE